MSRKQLLTDEQWANFSKILSYVPQGAGPEALLDAVALALRGPRRVTVRPEQGAYRH